MRLPHDSDSLNTDTEQQRKRTKKKGYAHFAGYTVFQAFSEGLTPSLPDPTHRMKAKPSDMGAGKRAKPRATLFIYPRPIFPNPLALLCVHTQLFGEGIFFQATT